MSQATVAAPERFQLLGPLPEGTTVLEASAGTGKTYTIAALVTRYVAEGIAAMDELLVVSFSRESTRELRERVRERLVCTRDALANLSDGGPATEGATPGDRVVAHLAADPAEIPVRLRRLQEALAHFDAATVTTTHGFCQQVLLTLGTAGDHDPSSVLVEDLGDLITEVADDLYIRKWGYAGAPPKEDLTREDFLKLASAVAKDPSTRLLPDHFAVVGLPLLRARIAGAVRDEVDKRKRRQHLFSYDDLLTRVAGTLTDPQAGPAARERLRARYRIVLVDEFQDTDPVQWSILREAFHGHRTLVLIGDPKQAIYGFRGADVYAYLAAAQAAAARHTLPTNWRSDAPLVAGLDAVFRGAALGDPRIRVLPVEAAQNDPMVDAGPPVRLRVLPRDDLALNKDGTAKTAEAKEAVARDLTTEVVGLLSGGAVLRPRDGGPERPLQPGDLAVLVRSNRQATQVQTHLSRASVPVVVTGRTSVFAMVAAEQWQLLLEALEQPHRTTRVRRLALSCFLGRTATELDARGDAYADDLALRVRVWGRVLAERGVAALFEAVSAEHPSVDGSLQHRILGTVGGERLLTDLRHLAEALHEATLEHRLGLTALLAWLRRRRAEAGREGGLERSRRLESDAAAVQVLTMHQSKGLEFPVVLVPFAWDGWTPKVPLTAAFHDANDERVRDVGGEGSPDWFAHVAKHKQEEIDDELRLLYVAATRAQSHLWLWWAPTYNTPQAPLHRLLLHEDHSVPPPLSITVPSDADALTTFRDRARASEGTLAVEVVPSRAVPRWSPPAASPPALSAARFERGLDLSWRRTSYSALTAGAHDHTQGAAFGSEPEGAQTDDESDVEISDVTGGHLTDGGASVSADATAVSETDDAYLRDVASAWDTLTGGTGFGTLVHAALERLEDFADPDALREAVAAQTARYGLTAETDTLTAALTASLATPLGPLADGAALRDLAAADRLPELDFELPLAGGDAPRPGARAGEVLLADLVPLWRRHCPTGLLSSYAAALASLEPAPLRGYLTGSIDAVLRVGPPTARRYLVVDYKTNRLGVPGEPLTAWHYRPEALEQAMIEAHYPLQALLYDVALHRYLRWRDPAYDPEISLGGVLYLFLRGMTGPDVAGSDGSAPGVFAWRPPAALVLATSDLLAGA